MAEWLLRRKLCNLPLALFFSLFFIMSVAAAYEIIEWQYAVIDDGEAGLEFLGSQGDIWTRKRHACRYFGRVNLAVYFCVYPTR